MNGIINVYKPKGITSHDVVYKIRRLTGIKKVGHTGTLDPDAEGVLPICIGRGTRLSDMLTLSDKGYRATLKLGVTTDTQDSTGAVISEVNVESNKEEILACIMSFVGEIQQIPPMYSAIKIGGKKLYELARKGIEIQRNPRDITVYSIENICFESDTIVTFDVLCSKGTYIRSLCNDIGEKLGCGGVMDRLIRIKSGQFVVDKAVKLEELTNENISDYLVPCEKMFDYEKLVVDGENLRKVLNGNIIYPNLIEDGKMYKVFDSEDNFLSVSQAKGRELRIVKGFY